ncbi:DUF7562 family protein [Halanaeroarchaeum sulfurireducens]|uniref:Small CPxCG-related zinc finger protein n=1 Tax=Halanaeroarchaeum sulfurireducens TaxID=1604004 RepID=A0A0F7PB57_9EURY|nr:hypothetical protein [Halanaeroarchaeum sulfurireducens]AKH96869.1 hypothetical protein HLASF_0363 [Halanaeroarchaeum sulfurireducens]ALG81271.1 hypothetical protein HLASA_0362 [Halanaeroarchaeum sulfurireducens]
MGIGLSDRPVTCIACGERVPRSVAREYDKHGDRWNREGKSFEYFCKDCHRDLTKQPRDGLETLLEQSGAGRVPDDVFLGRFAKRVERGDTDCD